MFKKLIKRIRKAMAPKAFKTAVKHANHIKYTTGLKSMVLLTPQGFKAYTKQAIKLMIKQGLMKGVTIQNIEQKAFYITN
jgi:hypothetical protein